ncbi:hypothetical protein AAHA92_08873 [Salvia divinorum]|uniref:Uncharacterized protein n=1 Tax=Salvia divinorum TaxID=28513 RepID=A0ABD1HT29_SALDI
MNAPPKLQSCLSERKVEEEVKNGIWMGESPATRADATISESISANFQRRNRVYKEEQRQLRAAVGRRQRW